MKLQIILGSIREGRKGEKVARWVFEKAKARKEFEVELLDLRDWPLPFYSHPTTPDSADHEPEEIVKKWAQKISQGDGYIVVTPEYNHGYPAALKNAFDHLYKEWVRKPIAFVSYSGGLAAGIRAVEQFRLVAIEFQMAPVRSSIHIPYAGKAFDESGEIGDSQFNDRLQKLFEQMAWWGKVLSRARKQS